MRNIIVNLLNLYDVLLLNKSRKLCFLLSIFKRMKFALTQLLPIMNYQLTNALNLYHTSCLITYKTVEYWFRNKCLCVCLLGYKNKATEKNLHVIVLVYHAPLNMLSNVVVFAFTEQNTSRKYNLIWLGA